MNGLEYMKKICPTTSQGKDPNREDVADAFEDGIAEGYIRAEKDFRIKRKQQWSEEDANKHTLMQKYTHDYTKIADAESHLFAAQQLNAHNDPIEAWEHIEDARRLLQEYLAQDNMVEDDDVAEGWVKAKEVEEIINQKED